MCQKGCGVWHSGFPQLHKIWMEDVMHPFHRIILMLQSRESDQQRRPAVYFSFFFFLHRGTSRDRASATTTGQQAKDSPPELYCTTYLFVWTTVLLLMPLLRHSMITASADSSSRVSSHPLLLKRERATPFKDFLTSWDSTYCTSSTLLTRHTAPGDPIARAGTTAASALLISQFMPT
ncbi:hypothetical protein VTL71DRAFT_13673 [Oculimacula yallundae]|uniref:Uncharacterized protein n=1 Tax=Oculimacula yallundae TaxID=86028 RepID=A0ABR4CLN4_9HELO